MVSSSTLEQLTRQFQQKNATIGIIGLGYVGLPLLLRCCEVGYGVWGFDIDAEKIACLSRGDSYIEHIPKNQIAQYLLDSNQVKSGEIKPGYFYPSADFSHIAACEVIIICVPTPLDKHRDPDLSFIHHTLTSILPYLHVGQLLSLESTTYPGTTDEELAPKILEQGLKPGENFFLVYSPEREDPGNHDYSTKNTPKVCGGFSENCLQAGIRFYQSIVDTVVPVSSTRVAELTKLLENIFRAVNIGLVNEMKIIADKMGIDIHEAIRAAATKPFGFVPYQPGPGLGGHCIPIDPFYLTWKAREYGVNTRFIELAGEINAAMPEYVVSKCVGALNERGVALAGARILILGIAYKKNVNDMRESPALMIMEKLATLGADIFYSDPHVPVFPRLQDNYFALASESLTAETLHTYDAVILVTDHDDFDYELIQKNSRLIIDTRGRYSESHLDVIKA
jgi:UDP-N-acetyl-D-glucosamine dehydrogenase